MHIELGFCRFSLVTIIFYSLLHLVFGHWSEDCNDEQVSNINIYIYMTSLRNDVICLSVSVSSIYIWSKTFGQ
jgi:hypothetical protein